MYLITFNMPTALTSMYLSYYLIQWSSHHLSICPIIAQFSLLLIHSLHLFTLHTSISVYSRIGSGYACKKMPMKYQLVSNHYLYHYQHRHYLYITIITILEWLQNSYRTYYCIADCMLYTSSAYWLLLIFQLILQ